MSGIDPAAGRLQPGVSADFVSIRHQKIDPATSCWPPGPQTGWSCWSYWKGGGQSMEGIGTNGNVETSISEKYLFVMDIFRCVCVGVHVHEPYRLKNVNFCYLVRLSSNFSPADCDC